MSTPLIPSPSQPPVVAATGDRRALTMVDLERAHDGRRPLAIASPMAFGEHLRAARRARGWLQRELAARLGLSASSVVFWENGRRLPDRARLAQIVEALGVDDAVARRLIATCERAWTAEVRGPLTLADLERFAPWPADPSSRDDALRRYLIAGRLARGWTLDAWAARVGVCKVTAHAWNTGRFRPQPVRDGAIIAALGLAPDARAALQAALDAGRRRHAGRR